MRPKIGVYICHCGLNIANTVDVEAVREFAKSLPNVIAAHNYTYMCSDPGQALITNDIKELGLTHVVVASCSPRMHEPTFRAAIQKSGLNPYCLEMANIREQCSWVHSDRKMATLKAMDLVASAVAKVAWLVPLEEREVGVSQAALVVGGGIAGMQAALDIADAGFQAYLVEKQPYLGGRAAQLHATFPTMERMSDLLAPLMQRVNEHPNVRVMTNADVVKVDGYVGNFRATVRERATFVDAAKCDACGKCVDACPVTVPDAFNANLTTRRAIYRPTPDSPFVVDEQRCTYVQDHVCIPPPQPSPVSDRGGGTCVGACLQNAIDFSQTEKKSEIDLGAIIVATGAATFDASAKPELGFGAYANVITSLQFERLANATGPTGGKIEIDGKTPKDIVFIQCVGSRDKTTGNVYCSRVCCMVNAKQAHIVKEKFPDAKVTVFYADVRAFGKGHEEFYDAVRKEGVRYRRGYVSEVFKRGPAKGAGSGEERIVVRAEDTLMQKPVEVEADLAVLGIGLTPRAETDEIANILGLPRSGDGFLLEVHPKLRPVETAMDGVFLAGTCQGPKDIVDTLAQARAAASSALAPLCRGKVKIESATSQVNEEMCAGCGLCVATCPYGAPAINPRTGKARVNAVLCKGCGACEAACPSKAIQVMQFTPRQVLSQIAVLA
ncbi:MAG: CoB--CoM heterodisulfide reductase iron-sulfur subunit A family protein [Chloroflexota bacterium]|nr:CoB--CoM heterodisulfide reductase iron-sulfur subunit A family protein [Chloroflexota bacterium]